MLDEAVKHIREAIMLGRTDIIKKLLEEVHSTLVNGKNLNSETRFYKTIYLQFLTFPVIYKQVSGQCLACSLTATDKL